MSCWLGLALKVPEHIWNISSVNETNKKTTHLLDLWKRAWCTLRVAPEQWTTGQTPEKPKELRHIFISHVPSFRLVQICSQDKSTYSCICCAVQICSQDKSTYSCICRLVQICSQDKSTYSCICCVWIKLMGQKCKIQNNVGVTLESI